MTLIEGISLAETQAEEPIVEFFDPTKLKEVQIEFALLLKFKWSSCN